KGVPIFYTPYFSHADPSVKYKTGLLFPTFGTLNSELFYMQPVYWNISAHEDATFTPIYANEQAMLGLEYRKQIKNGSLFVEGALSQAQNDANTNDKDQSGPIGFAHVKGEINFNPQWRSHFDVGATNDREFLGDNPLWPGLSSSLINNKVTLEGFNNHNYINASTLWYQELDTGDETDHPVILPELSYHGVSDADAIGGRFNYMAGLRQYGKSSIIESGQRLNLEGKYTLPLLLPKGIMTTSEVNLRGDLYHTDFTEEGLESSDHYKDGSAHRLVPRANIDVRYPFMRQTDYGNQVAEPVMALFIAPNDAGNDKAIGNTDSSLFENDDSNLMSMDRIPGLDRIEEGSRLVVGGNFSHFFKDGKKIQAFAGQSFELAEDNVLDEELGINASDDQIVGRVNLNLDNFGDYYYRFNLSSEDQSILKNELNFNLGSPAFRVSGGYSYVNKQISTNSNNYERVHGSLSSQLNDRWKASATSSFDMYEDRSISNTLGLIYEDECFIFTSNLSNKYYEDEQDEQAVMFSLTFKTVGSFQSAPISTRTEEE
ncbi:MAG: LPS-assembly protein LptD, partial [Alphaproteobacteria bacterium]